MISKQTQLSIRSSLAREKAPALLNSAFGKAGFTRILAALKTPPDAAKWALPLLIFALNGTFLPRRATAQSATRMTDVRTVFSRRASGDAFFNRNLRAALRARGLRFTNDKSRADAILDTSGNGTRNGGFAGQMTFIGRNGRVLSHESVVRPPQSKVMAYRSLARKARISKP